MPVHLHVHSAFSFLDGCSYPEEMVQQAADLGYRAIALTDHDNLCGAIRFIQAARDCSVKPILGAEVTILEDDPRSGCEHERFHLTLLAATRRGYGNLCRLITQGYEIGGRRTPAVPRQMLEALGDGLIALSGCRQGQVPRLILHSGTGKCSGSATSSRCSASICRTRDGCWAS